MQAGAGGIREAKRGLREQILADVERLPPSRRALEEELVAAAVQAQPDWEAARTVFLYRSVAPEMSTVGLVLGAWRAGKRVGLPRVNGKELVFHEVRAWSELKPGAYGIPEPAASSPILSPDVADLIIVPGVAFDEDGHRLGRGAGFYDRFLGQAGAPKWGIAFDCQVIPQVPTEPTDHRVSRVFCAKLAQP